MIVEHTGTARLGRRTKELVHRLQPERHRDHRPRGPRPGLRRGAGRVGRARRRQRRPSQSGRFPNPGPLQLVRGGVRLIDVPVVELFERISDGERLTVAARSLFRNGTCLAPGSDARRERARRGLAEQQSRVTEALEAFADNTMRYLREEGPAARPGDRLPPARPASAIGMPSSSPAGRATSATCGSFARTSATSSPFSSRSTAAPRRCSRPGWRPDVIVGDMDSVSDARRFGAARRSSSTPTARATRPARSGSTGSASPVPASSGAGDLGGHRAAARSREGRGADRRRRHPLQPRRVPRAEPRRDVVHVRDAG